MDRNLSEEKYRELPVYGIILAGGQSTRMGTDKALLDIGGKPLLRRLAERMLSLGLNSVTVSVSGNEQEKKYRAALGESLAAQIRFVQDEYPGCGPLAGLHAGLSGLPAGYAFVMACDMPVLSEPLLRRMLERAALKEVNNKPDVIRTGGQPFHALYHTRTARMLLERLKWNDLRVMAMLSELETIILELSAEEEAAFINLNTPEMYEKFVSGSSEQRNEFD
ncbi:molybdenum cofactor guanylyltransferase [Paenibacillus sp. sptzw28]|uniref:molybdenum cofactor guanylyltransferase n=1 Tax=Paenibacillus sp. sptzw28 TaxID=715179 RepID=UPI001C6E3896|nr:molybdenum cofactor guanylyltransferase [Paenibacillus sp. sptzw28]QYR22004.1 molybdenum cofactor guanylyltransferase [Paenibacillus sp. sptzw28]